METLTVDTEEKDLERLFAEARRYPLLTAAQEREVDTNKWAAVKGMQDLFARDPRHNTTFWSGRATVLSRRWISHASTIGSITLSCAGSLRTTLAVVPATRR